MTNKIGSRSHNGHTMVSVVWVAWKLLTVVNWPGSHRMLSLSAALNACITESEWHPDKGQSRAQQTCVLVWESLVKVQRSKASPIWLLVNRTARAAPSSPSVHNQCSGSGHTL